MSLEILSILFLITFLLIRYAFSREKLSRFFLFLFIFFIILEAILALFVYQQTGKIETFQIVIGIFILYAFTFGISDFRKLDRFIKDKVGKWRGVDLLTAEDRRIMAHLKDPKVVARKSRIWWYAHTIVFMIGHYILWINFGHHAHDFIYYLSDLSWWPEEGFENGPFQNEVVAGMSKVWTIIYLIDTIYSWSYTLFPSNK